MANHSSSEKRHRQTITRTLRNRSARSGCRTLIKAVREAITKGDQGAARTALHAATIALDSAASKGVLHRSAASRSVSRLTQAVNGLSGAASA